MCGICGIFGNPNAVSLTRRVMSALQHRGQEGAGIAVANSGLLVHKKPGLVHDLFRNFDDREGVLSLGARLRGTVTLGQNRYSTSGSSSTLNLQPFYEDGLALVFNGNIANSSELRNMLEKEGVVFKTDVDTEVIINDLLKDSSAPLEKRVLRFSKKAVGAYSMILLEEKKEGASLTLVRDPLGFRPLVIGKLDEGFVAASETCALQPVKAKYLQEVEPGEVIRIDSGGVNTLGFIEGTGQRAYCIFELVYLAMPDSRIFGQSIGAFKEATGMQLACEHPVVADVVVGVPNSGTRAAEGYSIESGIPKRLGLDRNNYVDKRSFIEPDQNERNGIVSEKFFVDPEIVDGKRAVLVDDSIVRGTTAPKVISLLREYGAKEVHMRVAAPPIGFPCFFGVDFPDQRKLTAHNKTIEEICSYIGADSLGYLSVGGMLKCGAHKASDYCAACFTGNYPLDVSCALETQQQRIELRGRL